MDNLRSKIAPYVQGDQDLFVVSAMSEAKHLSEAAFGTAFLHTIGCDAGGPLPWTSMHLCGLHCASRENLST